MAAVGETEDAFVEFEGYVHVDVIDGFLAGLVGGLVGALEKLFCIGEPDELAVEFEVQGDAAAIEIEE